MISTLSVHSANPLQASAYQGFAWVPGPQAKPDYGLKFANHFAPPGASD